MTSLHLFCAFFLAFLPACLLVFLCGCYARRHGRTVMVCGFDASPRGLQAPKLVSYHHMHESCCVPAVAELKSQVLQARPGVHPGTPPRCLSQELLCNTASRTVRRFYSTSPARGMCSLIVMQVDIFYSNSKG